MAFACSGEGVSTGRALGLGWAFRLGFSLAGVAFFDALADAATFGAPLRCVSFAALAPGVGAGLAAAASRCVTGVAFVCSGEGLPSGRALGLRWVFRLGFPSAGVACSDALADAAAFGAPPRCVSFAA
jgi:hypothetical protein